MTLSQILQDSYRRLGFTSSPSPEVVARLTAFANETHHELLSLSGIDQLRDDTIPVTTTANGSRSALPPSVGRIALIHDRTRQVVLKELTLAEIIRRDPGLVFTGTTWAFARAGAAQVAVQPSVASELFVKSTSASDVSEAYVEGIRTGGYPVALSVRMTGVTAVSLGTTITDVIDVTKCYLSAPAVGTVTLTQTSGAGTELARIAAGQTVTRYQTVQWHPIPATATTFYVDYTRQVQELVQSNDEPLLPPDFHRLIGTGIRMREYEKSSDERLSIAAAEYASGSKALRHFVQTDGTGVVSLRGRRYFGWSQLGPYYPTGS